MPNWCTNRLYIHGPEKSITKFINDNKATITGPRYGLKENQTHHLALSLERLLPTPRNDDGTLIGEGTRQRGNTTVENDWYTWRMVHWGTKWDLGNDTDLLIHSVSDKTSAVEYVFNSADYPPLKWLDHAAALYPSLFFKLSYEEPDMDLYGLVQHANGRKFASI